MASPEVFTTRADGPAVEQEVAFDLVKRGVLVVPVFAVLAGLVWGWAGVASVAFASALVLANLWLSAALLGWAARINLGLVMGVALFGFLLRMVAVIAAVLLVKDQGWVSPVPLGIALVVTHLGLLFWEARHVSATLAFPGLKPGSTED